MAMTDNWNSSFEASPADSDNRSEGATKIRQNREAVRERLNSDHFVGDTTYTSPDATDITNNDTGYHRQTTLKDAGVVGNPPANHISLHNVGGVLKQRNSSGTDTIITASGGSATFSDVHIIDNTTSSYDLILDSDSDSTILTADRTLTFDVNNANRTVDLAGDLTVEASSLVNQDLTTDASPTFSSIHVNDNTTSSYDLILDSNSDSTILTADRTLTFDVNNANRVVDLGANLTVEATTTVNQDLTTDASPTFSSVHLNDVQSSGYDLIIRSNGECDSYSSDRTLSIDVFDADRCLALEANVNFEGTGSFCFFSQYAACLEYYGAYALCVAGTSVVNQNLTTSASPTFSSIHVNDNTTTAYDLIIDSDSDGTVLTADRTLTFDVNNGSRNLLIEADSMLNQDLTTDASPTFGNIKITSLVCQGTSVASGARSSAFGLASVSCGANSFATGCCSATHGDGSFAANTSTACGCLAGAVNNGVAFCNLSFATGTSSACGFVSFSAGVATTSYGQGSSTFGLNTISCGENSFATGECVISHSPDSLVVGEIGTIGDSCTLLAVANGSAGEQCTTSGTDYGLVFKVACDGCTRADAGYSSGGADYAEYFEADHCIQPGYFTSFKHKSNKIEEADSTSNIEDIVGITSATPAVTGDANSSEWHGKYVTSPFGIALKETYIEDGKEKERKVISNAYNSECKYIPREERPEWNAVGLIGKLWVHTDDENISIGDFVTYTDGGKAKKANIKNSWRVIDVNKEFKLVRILYKKH